MQQERLWHTWIFIYCLFFSLFFLFPFSFIHFFHNLFPYTLQTLSFSQWLHLSSYSPLLHSTLSFSFPSHLLLFLSSFLNFSSFINFSHFFFNIHSTSFLLSLTSLFLSNSFYSCSPHLSHFFPISTFTHKFTLKRFLVYVISSSCFGGIFSF